MTECYDDQPRVSSVARCARAEEGSLPPRSPAVSKDKPNLSRRKFAVLASILLLAFGLRTAWRVHMGSADFWQNGYSFFYDMASNIAAGRGLNIEGGAWAMRTPLYPLFLALTALGGKNYLWIVITQAFIGAGTTFCTFLIGRELFGWATGMLASLLTAFYPYYGVHDTALQDTSLLTFVTALAVFLLLRARRGTSVTGWVFAGIALGAAVLTRPTIAPFALCALVWIGVCGEGAGRRRLRRVLVILLPVSLTVGCWLVRNWFVVGAPILTSELGRQLWLANNAKTFSHYPSGSIDRSAGEAYAALTPTERRELKAVSRSETRQSDWFRKKALDYIRTHPLKTIRAAVRKIAAGFSWRFNPAREPLVQTVYLASYAPISMLGFLGMAVTWRRWREHSLIYLLFLTFAAVTAVFWAHSSHRSYLDLYLIVFSAYLVNRVFSPLLHAARPDPSVADTIEDRAGRAAVVLACARRFVRQGPRDELRATLRSDPDWLAILQMAEEHSVAPLLHTELLELDYQGWASEESRSRLEAQARSNLALTAELLHMLQIFEQHGIPSIAIKGPVLAAVGHGNLGLRSFADLDLLIRPDDLAPANDVLTGSGYRLVSDLHWNSDSARLRSKDGEILLEHADSGIRLDLHWRLLPEYLPQSLDGDQLWENLASVPLGRRTVPTLSAENQLLFLAAHGGKHCWERLGWICDFTMALNRSRIDWQQVLSRARQAHIERMLFVGLRLADDLFEAELPDAVKEMLDADPKIVELASEVRNRLLEGSPMGRSAAGALSMNLRMLERTRDKIRYLAGILFTPGEAEWRHASLPPALYFLYYPYRVMRLVRKYAAAMQMIEGGHQHSSVSPLQRHPPA